ncbi:hypothetical protein KFK09_016662 [Dendrobium nobile]|uniref:Uncharacterized protein n=1 Tax=Dendrobium nobile TaxID=94219 RepID=A0A8T3B003_DENNO|nr:hypothetical protein KFK09_016662 [Dendrobium nobile]
MPLFLFLPVFYSPFFMPWGECWKITKYAYKVKSSKGNQPNRCSSPKKGTLLFY